MRKKINSIDVARKAGVSRATVSYVLNNVVSESISEKTKERVFKAAKDLGYVPNAAGQALVSKRTKNIGLLFLDSQASHPFLLQIIEGLTSVVRDNNLRLLIDSVSEENHSEAMLSMSRAKRIDGLVLFETRENDEELRTLVSEHFPVVIIGEHPDLVVCSVDIDTISSAEKAVNHLISIGHRKIACITNAPIDYTAASSRLEGYKKALENAGIEYDPSLVRYGKYDEESGMSAMNELLEIREEKNITACFVASDRVAFGAMRAITKAGLRIPEDFAVIGFDDVIHSRFYNPPLSTIHFSAVDQGRVAGEMLIKLIDEEIKPGERIIQETKLIVRESTVKQ